MKERLWLIILSIVLLALNIFLIWPLFQGGYTQYLGSIECQYFAYARHISEEWPHISWDARWYFGFPFYLVYQPILPFALALGKALTSLPFSTIYRALTFFFYLLTPLSIFLWLRYLTKQLWVGFLAALFYTFLPSVVYLFVPGVSAVAESYNYLPWHLIVFGLFGEGAHIWALAFVPLSLLFFHRLLEKESFRNWFWALFFTLLVLLTSLTAFMPLALILLLILIIECFRGEGTKKLIRILIFGIFLLGMASFWYNYSFWRAGFLFSSSTEGFSRGILGQPSLLLFLFLPILSLIFVLGSSLLTKSYKKSVYFILGGGLVWFLTAFVLYYSKKINIMPIPNQSVPRLGPEIDLLFSGFLALILVDVFQKIKKVGMIILLILVFVVGGWQINNKKESFWQFLKPQPNLDSSSEYQVANWLAQNTKPHQRVYLTGTHAFWLNVWTDVWQMRGVKGGDFGGLNPLWDHLTYQIYYGEDGELAVNWLKALGIQYIVVNFPESKVTYKDYRHPYKFEGLLKRVFEYQGDVIYEVPVNYPGIVAKAEKEELDKAGVLWNAKEGKITLDKERLNQYLKATELSPEFKNLPYEYKKPWNELKIPPTDLKPGEEVLVRISYNSGWRAFQNGKRLKIERDPLGFMIISPPNSNSEITLLFRPTLDVYLGYLLSLIALIAFIFFLKSSIHRFARSPKKKLESRAEEEGEGA